MAGCPLTIAMHAAAQGPGSTNHCLLGKRGDSRGDFLTLLLPNLHHEPTLNLDWLSVTWFGILHASV